MARPPLREIQLTGARAVARVGLFGAIAVLALVGAVGYLLPAHRLVGETAYHANRADGGILPVLVFVGVAASAVALVRRRWGAGFLLGATAAVGALLAMLPVFLVHLFQHVDRAYGEQLYAVGVIGTFVAGIAALVAEPLLYLGQRRQLERDARPVFPIARAITRRPS